VHQRIWSWLPTFQRAIDEVRTLLLTSPKGGSKSQFFVYKLIHLYFRNRWSQLLQIGHAAGVCQRPSPNFRRKSGFDSGLRELPKIWGFLFNISAMAEDIATSNLVHSLGLPRPIIKSHPEEKCAWLWARGAPQNFLGSFKIFLQYLKLATSNLACSWGLPKTIIKPHAE